MFILIFLLVLPGIFAPQLAPHNPLRGSLRARLKPPVWVHGGSLSHPLGTDKVGRDILSRIIYGARVSLSVSLVAILVTLRGVGVAVFVTLRGALVAALMRRFIIVIP